MTVLDILDRIYLHCNVVAIAVLGFLLVGVGAIGCIILGVIETAKKDTIFQNDGLGEVMTVLGIYFTIPYLFILLSFAVVTGKLRCMAFLNRDFGVLPMHVMFAITVAIYVGQQLITDKYLTVLRGDSMWLFLIPDALVLGAYVYFRGTQYGGMLYAVLFSVKMAVQWGEAYRTAQEPFFGPNGVSAMLFVCIPMIQFPLYTASIGPETQELAIVEAFTSTLR